MVRLQWLLLWAIQVWGHPTEPVRVRGGLLQGTLSRDGSYAKYLGIPYATVKERFQAAEPEPTWDGILNATNGNIKCLQRSSGQISGQEDCLVLNVYSPEEQTDQLRPVMVFIHGDDYKYGFGNSFLYGPDYLLQHNVIFVSINYRLGILGFLCLRIAEAPGNVGLKDQVQALKWVKNNIKAFGGNPDDVTIFGQNAGSSSIHYHILSPMSKGLFHKAIMQSSTASCPWSIQFEPVRTASLFAEQLRFQTKYPSDLYQLLSIESSEKLLTAEVPRAKGDISLSEIIFVPCIEDEISGVERFLPDSPYNLMKTGQYNEVPIIIGYNNAEGYEFASRENIATIEKITIHDSLPRNLLIPSETERNKTAEKLKCLYKKKGKISKQSRWNFSKYVGDSQIVYPVVADADLFSRTMDKPVFAYKFKYAGLLNLAKRAAGFTKYPGATHGDELFYLLKIRPSFRVTNKDRAMIVRLTTLWTNFVKYGDPTPNSNELLPTKWRPIDKMDPQVFVIDREFLTEPLWNDNALLYWNSTYTKYRRMS